MPQNYDRRTAVFFYLALAASFAFHLSQRERHFQECDSTTVYFMMTDFPREARRYNDFAAPNPSEREHRSRIIDWVDEAFPEPGFFRGMLAVPLSSTYSLAHGAVYSAVLLAAPSFNEFMSGALIATLAAFHLSALLLFRALRDLDSGVGPALFLSFLFLFSVSHYSYGYSLNSTVWNILASVLWLRALIGTASSRDLVFRMSLVTALLTVFSYTVLVLYAGFAMFVFAGGAASLPDWGWSRASRFVRSCLKGVALPVSMILLYLFLFYQTGQGNRGTALHGPGEAFRAVYFIVLNFFSIYNESAVFDLVQFLLGFGLAASIIRSDYARSRRSKFKILFRAAPDGRFLNGRGIPFTRTECKRDLIFAVGTCILLAFGLMIGFRMLGFSPSRHILFLSPLVYLGAGISLRGLEARGQRALLASAALLTVLAPFAFARRVEQVRDPSPRIPYAENLEVIQKDCTTFYHPPGTRFLCGEPEPGNSYLYLSQTEPASEFVKPTSGTAPFSVSEAESIELDVFFLAYNPFRYPHNRPNRLYWAVLKAQ